MAVKAKKAVLESEYEKLTGKTDDGVGRPAGRGAEGVAFSFLNKDKRLAAQAKRRATVVLLTKRRAEAREIFEQEYVVLATRQGYEDIEVSKRSVEKEFERRPFKLGSGSGSGSGASRG